MKCFGLPLFPARQAEMDGVVIFEVECLGSHVKEDRVACIARVVQRYTRSRARPVHPRPVVEFVDC